MEIQLSERLNKLPPYLFADLRRKIAAARQRGVKVICLGIGDPDTPTPDPVVRELCRAVDDPADPNRHRYGCDVPVEQFPQAVRELLPPPLRRERWPTTRSSPPWAPRTPSPNSPWPS